MPDDVELSILGEVATVQLRRPTSGNALRGATFEQLRKIGLRLTDAPPRFVVLCGEGPDFCVGLDRNPDDVLYQTLEPVAKSRDAYRMGEIIVRLRTAFDLIARTPCPVIAAIEGRWEGAGAELALVADFRVVAEDAVFRFNDGTHGLVTGLGGISRATSLLGAPTALERVLTGRPATGSEALSLGLANRVTPRGAALSTAHELLQDMRRTSPIARTQALLAARSIAGRQLNDWLEQECQAAARTWIAMDWRTAHQAEKERREPPWS